MTKTCCLVVQSPRAGADIPSIRRRLQSEIAAAIEAGCTHFVCGFSGEIDWAFAALVVAFKHLHPSLTLEALLAYRNQIYRRDAPFRKLLRRCSLIGVHSERYAPGCSLARDETMLRLSQRCILVLGKQKGEAHCRLARAALPAQDIALIRAR